MTGEQLYLVDQTVKIVTMQMHIVEAEDKTWSLRRDYSNALQAACYEDIIYSKPHISINRILKKLKPHQLYLQMLDIMEWKKIENFHKRKFR